MSLKDDAEEPWSKVLPGNYPTWVPTYALSSMLTWGQIN